ncbi:hypothetical protein L218DRAFT_944681 [Marasmius fiardii PR-910]|nr:hypothetical protein L218DRAFT_951462 [Marasmius fiardii PR-910]KAF9263145.1 hypothetical protein L218DRAFT_944681 [Marasmius fiardii PR-910]
MIGHLLALDRNNYATGIRILSLVSNFWFVFNITTFWSIFPDSPNPPKANVLVSEVVMVSFLMTVFLTMVHVDVQDRAGFLSLLSVVLTGFSKSVFIRKPALSEYQEHYSKQLSRLQLIPNKHGIIIMSGSQAVFRFRMTGLSQHTNIEPAFIPE